MAPPPPHPPAGKGSITAEVKKHPGVAAVVVGGAGIAVYFLMKSNSNSAANAANTAATTATNTPATPATYTGDSGYGYGGGYDASMAALQDQLLTQLLAQQTAANTTATTSVQTGTATPPVSGWRGGPLAAPKPPNLRFGH